MSLTATGVAGRARPEAAWRGYRTVFTLENLNRICDERAARLSSRGLDRINPSVFKVRRSQELRLIYRKAQDRSYRLTPYLEVLLSRGRARPPRVLSIPTVRDRIFLAALNDVLHRVFPDRVQRLLPNAHVRNILSQIEAYHHHNLHFFRGDIRSFFDSISHTILADSLGTRIRSKTIRSVVMRAVRNPTVPWGYRRKHRSRYLHRCGIPQGLPISSVLANLYLGDLDKVVAQEATSYHRYVDDILILGDKSEVEAARTVLEARLSSIGLELNTEKTEVGPISKPFEFLGYRFKQDSVTVRDRTIDRFIAGLAGRFTSLHESWEARSRGQSWLDGAGWKQVFVEELNLATTGAISERRRYGWLFYFLEINDHSLLHRLDAIVSSLFDRSPLFGNRPATAKRFARAYYEARYRPDGGYLLNYDTMYTLAQKIDFLIRFGQIDGVTKMPRDEIDALFERTKRRQLRGLELDVGTIS